MEVPEPRDETLPERFQRLREAAGLTKTAVAGSQYSVGYVSQIEAGLRNPSTEALAYFAQQLGVDARYLSTGIPEGLQARLEFGLERMRLLLRSGRAAEAQVSVRSLVEEAERFGLSSLHGSALFLDGVTLVRLGRIREAIDRFEEALETDLPEQDRGIATASLARAYVAVGDLGYGAQLIEAYLGARRVAPMDPAVSAEMHGVVIRIYLERGDVVKAERAARRGLAAAEQSVSPQVRANVLWSAARVLAEAKHWDEALALSREARVIIEQQDDRRRLASINNSYAFLCLDADPPRTEEAARHLDAAEALLTDDGPSVDLAYVYTERSRLALLQGSPDEALVHCERALPLCGDDQLERGRALFVRGRALALLARYPEAIDSLHEAAAVFGKSGARQQATSCWLQIGEIELEEGRLAAGLEALRSGLEALDLSRSRA